MMSAPGVPRITGFEKSEAEVATMSLSLLARESVRLVASRTRYRFVYSGVTGAPLISVEREIANATFRRSLDEISDEHLLLMVGSLLVQMDTHKLVGYSHALSLVAGCECAVQQFDGVCLRLSKTPTNRGVLLKMEMAVS